MTLGQLVNLEQEKLADEHASCSKRSPSTWNPLRRADLRRSSSEDLEEIETQARRRAAHRDQRRGTRQHRPGRPDHRRDDGGLDQPRGYIKRTPASVYRHAAPRRQGAQGAKTDEEDPIEHLFVASTHAYLLFFTNKGKVYWQKVYDLPQLARESRGRAIVNLLNLEEGRIRRLPAVATSTSPVTS
jgi:DNA gyrase subunit A